MTNLFPLSRCALAIQIVRPQESIAETQPPTPTGFAGIQAIDGWPINPHRTYAVCYFLQRQLFSLLPAELPLVGKVSTRTRMLRHGYRAVPQLTVKRHARPQVTTILRDASSTVTIYESKTLSLTNAVFGKDIKDI
jgi:hypothetical protein